MRTWAEVDLSAIRANARAFRSLLQGSALIAVIKADGYGHGAVRVSGALGSLADAYAVASPEEAAELRDSGVEQPILLLYSLTPDAAEPAIAVDASITISSLEELCLVADAATRARRVARVHVKVNTGMNRYGAAPDQVAELISVCDSNASIALAGLWTHFASADEPDDPFTDVQRRRFLDVASRHARPGLLRHVGNTATALNFPEMRFDASRIGIGLYGVYPSAESAHPIALSPALTWRARVCRVADLAAGESVSYNRRFIAQTARRIATVSVGYTDGYPRVASNRGSVLIRGRRAPILGSVCMDTIVCDVTDIPDTSYGDTATLIGRDGDGCISADELAAWGDTISYDVLTGLGRRVKRLYTS